jgi:hypothetical protein
MKSLAIHAALLTGLGGLRFWGTVASSVPAAAKCMLDEGYGAKLSTKARSASR